LLAQAVIGQALPQLYVGGWSDWCADPDGAIAKPGEDGERQSR